MPINISEGPMCANILQHLMDYCRN